MDIRNLTTFVQVAESGSFSKAAQLLGYSQPTISVQIRQLEEELGFRLFDRIGHAVRLTAPGKEALAYAQQICRLCGQMSQEAGMEEVGGLVRLATSDSLSACLIRENFPQIRSSYPGIRLNLTTAGTLELFQMLDRNEADLVCTLDSHIYNTNYVIAGEEKIGVHFVVSADSPLARKQSLTGAELLCQDFLLTEYGMSYRRLLDEWMARNSFEIQPVLETGRVDLICELVEQGDGIGFLPDYATEDAVSRGRVVRLDVEGFRPELWKQILYHKEKWLTPAMQAVIDLLVKK